jgi:hypothetical protein
LFIFTFSHERMPWYAIYIYIYTVHNNFRQTHTSSAHFQWWAWQSNSSCLLVLVCFVYHLTVIILISPS